MGRVVHVGEVGVDVELARSDEGAELGGVAVVFEDFDAVEPVLGVGAVDENAGGVPFAYGMDGLGVIGGAGGGDEVVEEATVRSPSLPRLASGWRSSSRIWYS